MAQDWRFTQLSGARRSLTLAGASAPHGRPRQGPVVSDGIKLRRQRVFYPDGGNRPPTTHIFGTEWKDWTLKGRFSDRDLGKGGTKAVIQEWQSFVVDGQDVQISWGDVLSARGIVDEFDPGRESEAESSYSITILVDARDIDGGRSAIILPRPPLEMCQALQFELLEGVGRIPSLPHAGDLKPSFLDTLEEAVSSINGFSASLLNVAGEIDAFAEGTLDQLERLRAGVVQIRTAVQKLRGTFETSENDAVLLARAADYDVQWFATRTSADVSTMRMLAILEELDREAEIARRGRVLGIHLARLGDTWESIATLFYGGPDRAGAIRDANGVVFGDLPIPGREYQVPIAG